MPTEAHLDRADGRHAARCWNADAPGIGVLALHGFTGAGADWAPLAEALGRRVLAPDLLGHGASPAPSDAAAYAIDRVVDHALAWCGPRAPWVVMGYSMGGRVALRLAARLGDRLGALVLISTSPGLEDAAARRARQADDEALADAIEAHGAAWFAERWAQHPLIQSQRSIPAPLREPMEARRLANRPAGLAGSLRGMGQGVVPPAWSALAAVRAPTLWITGDQDPTYTAIGARAVAALPHARHLRVPGAGHCTHLEALSPVTEAARAFLDEVVGA